MVTDHCPFTTAQRLGKRITPEFVKSPYDLSVRAASSVEHPWFDAEKEGHAAPAAYMMPGGVPGIENRAILAFSYGWWKKSPTDSAVDLSLLPQWVDRVSTAAARRFGLFPRKGTISPGSDADLALWDPKIAQVIRAEDLHHNCDYTIYSGLQCVGAPVHVLSHGEFVVKNRVFVGKRGCGKFLARSSPTVAD